MLRVIGFVMNDSTRKNARAYSKVIVQCVCKNVKEVELDHLLSGNTRSCGCFRQKASAERASKLNVSHGLTGHRFFRTWTAMHSRCYNSRCPEYKFYGARGIQVCRTWHNPFEFLKWCELTYPENAFPKVSLDRFPNKNGNYSPNNCRWATPVQQSRNTRRNRIINTPKGPMCIAAAAELFGIHRKTLTQRIIRWPDQEHRWFESVLRK